VMQTQQPCSRCGGKGKLTVHFYSDEQLRAFANLLGQYQTEE